MLAYANTHNIPLWTAARLLDFIKMRDEAVFSDIDWSDGQLTFVLTSTLKNKNGLTFMLPSRFGEKQINRIMIDGSTAKMIFRRIKGYDYALITIYPGKKYQILADYQ
jgi:hypothetical protein